MTATTEMRDSGQRNARSVGAIARRVPMPAINAALVFLVGLVVMRRFVNLEWTSFSGDSFTMQYDSLRLLQGEVPYRDFFSFPGPGTLALQALVFALFGARALHATHLLILTLAATGAELYALSYALSGRWLMSWFPPLFLFLALAPHQPTPYHQWYAWLPIIGTTLLVGRWLRHGRRGWLMAAGTTCAVTGLFVQTQGLAVAVALVAFLTLTAARDATRPRRLPGVLLPRLGVLAAGAAVIVVPVTVYFLMVGGLQQYVYDTLIWPPLHYGCRSDVRCLNNVPFLADLSAAFYWGLPQGATTALTSLPLAVRFYGGCLETFTFILMPIFAVSAALFPLGGQIGAIILRWRRGMCVPVVPPLRSVRGDLLALCALITLAFLAVFAIGENLALIHYIYHTIIAYPLLVGLIPGATHGKRRRVDHPAVNASRYTNAVFATIILGALIAYLGASDPPRFITVDEAAVKSEIATYVLKHTDPEDTIVNLPAGGALYFYSRPAAIGYTYVLPRVYPGIVLPPRGFHSPAQYREMADQIEKRRPRLIIFSPSTTTNAELYWESFPPDLYQFVLANYGNQRGQRGVAQNVVTGDGTYAVYIRQ